jgi:hypothetical protein
MAEGRGQEADGKEKSKRQKAKGRRQRAGGRGERTATGCCSRSIGPNPLGYSDKIQGGLKAVDTQSDRLVCTR